MKLISLIFISLTFFLGCSTQDNYNIIIKNGQIVDGSGNKSYKGDIGVNADTIAAIGDLNNATADKVIDASGLVVAPGFINMLSWAGESLIINGNADSDVKQGVTLEVMGEGISMGPLNDEMKEKRSSFMNEFKYNIEWTTLGEYLQYLENKGVSVNVASFVGATTLRIHEIKEEDREPTFDELQRMKQLAKTAMEEGAMGVSSALIYTPASYSKTDELIELCKVVSEYNGMYISHLRSEGDKLLEAIDELILIAKEANIAAEIYHLKIAGKHNWHKYDEAIKKIDSARNTGLKITTDMYNYIAGATGLDASMPSWVQEGGLDEWIRRLQDSAIRKKVAEEMKHKGDGWENLYYAAGNPDKLVFSEFRNDTLRYLTGKTLGEVSKMRGTSPEETMIDLVVQDGSRVGTIYYLMSEELVRKQIALPYMSFCSDEGAMVPVKPFTNYNPHPRAYGNFTRLLGKYVREEKLISMEEAIHKLSFLPASNLKIKKRGSLKIGNFADVVIFDAHKIIDKATFENPHQFAEGMVHVFVNGEQVIHNGGHTNAKPGRFVKGPGWRVNKK